MSFPWNRRTAKKISPPGGKFSDADLDHKNIFEDDFVHKNHLTVNYAGKGANFAIKNKATVDLKGASLEKPDPKTSYSTKIVTQVNGSAVETKLDNKGTVRVWADLGTYNYGRDCSVTGKVKTNNGFDRLSWALQFQTRYSDLSIATRIHNRANGVYFWNSRYEYVRGALFVGAVTKISARTALFSKFSVFGSYDINNKATVWAEYGNKGDGVKSAPKDSGITVAGRLRHGAHQYGVKLAYDLLNKADPINVEVGAVARCTDDLTVRARVDKAWNFALSAKHVVNKNLTLQVGTNVVLNNTNSFTTGKLVPVPIGVQLNFSYA